MGVGVGVAVGAGVGAGVAAGEGVGRAVGTGVGAGEAVARAVGTAVGAAVGAGVGTGVGDGDGVAGAIGPGPGPSDTDWVRWISGTDGGALVDPGVVATGSGFRVADLSGSGCIATAGRYPGSIETGGSVSTIRATTMETARPTPIPMNV